jgi:hypothetical protein
MLKTHIYIIIASLLLFGCNGKLPGADARKFPADPKLRVEQNMRAGKGFRLSEVGKSRGNGEFEFASSNALWRATLDILDFMPLASVNYSGGIIITDWYSDGNTSNESIKVSVRFLTNEIRSDAIDIKIFTKSCENNMSCKVFESNENIVQEMRKEILKSAALYKEKSDEEIQKENKDWTYPDIPTER